MSRYTGSLGRPIQGISQQPPQIRLIGQGEESVNFVPDVVEGLKTRAGTRLGVKISDMDIPENTKVHYYNRGTDEEYFIFIYPDATMEIFSPDGTQHVVNIVDSVAMDYLMIGGTPRKSIVGKTISDFTFLLNSEVKVLESPDMTPTPPKVGIAYVQFMDYSQTQAIYLKNPSDPDYVLAGSYLSPDGSSAGHKDDVATTNVAAALYASLTANGDFLDYVFTLDGSCIFIQRADGTDFFMKTTDDAGGDNLIPLKGSISDTSKLSPRAPDDFLIQINPAGANTKDNSAYWVKPDNSSAEISWRETVAPEVSVGMDLATMPVTLIRESITAGVATFDLKVGAWDERDVGDDRTNPLPSFVNNKLNNIGLFQNRLYVTSGESIIMTRTDFFFRFFRDSAQVSLDTDPIDVYADAEKVNILKASVPFDGDLVMFSENGQFVMLGSNVATPAAATLQQTTSFEAVLDAPPVASGENIFFAFDYGTHTGIREYFTDSVTDTKKARPITDHANHYIVGSPRLMKSSANIDKLVVQTASDCCNLYVYDWLWQGNDKVQSAWGKWNFNGDNIVHFEFNKSVLYLIIERPEGVFIEPLDLGDPVEIGMPYSLRLDREHELNWTWNDTTERWETIDPFPDYDLEEIGCFAGSDCYDTGILITMMRDGALLVTDEDLADKETNPTGHIGIYFTATYTMTNPVAKDQNGAPMELDALIVTHLIFNYELCGYVTYKVTDSAGNVREYEKANRIMGSPENVAGFSDATSGSHTIGIRKKSNQYKLDIEVKSATPYIVRDIQFNASFYPRGNRLTV